MKRQMRRGLAATLMVLLGAMALPVVASAARWCVGEPACVPSGGGIAEPVTGAGLQTALNAAEKHSNEGGPDEVLIGPGTFTNKGGFRYSGKELIVIRGAGEGATKLTAENEFQANSFVLETTVGTAPSLSGVTIVNASAKDTTGLGLNGGTVEGVSVEAGASSIGATGLKIDAGTFSHGSISVQPNELGIGVDMHGGRVLFSSIFSAQEGVVAGTEATLQGDRITGAFPVRSYSAEPLILEDSVIDMDGVGRVGVEVIANSGEETTAFVRHDALVQGAGGTGLVVGAQEADATVNVENTIFSETETPISIYAEGSKTTTASVLTKSSNYELAKVRTKENTPITSHVKFEHQNTIEASPSFVSAPTGDYHLAPGSPLIDAGSIGETLLPSEFPTDIAGNPRIVHGRTDMGPYEYQWRGPAVSPIASAASEFVGGVVNFSGTANPVEPGDLVKGYQWTFDDGTVVPSGATASHAFTTAGTHTATLTASDTLGITGSASVQVKVSVREVCAARSCSGCGPALSKCPALGSGVSGLAVSPHSFHAARHGTSFGKPKSGAKVSYTLRGEPVQVTFTVVRKAAGVASGKSCIPAGSGRHGKRCTRLVKVHGSFARRSVPGANSFQFTGRVGGAALGRGSYLLLATGRVAGQAFSAQAPFSISG